MTSGDMHDPASRGGLPHEGSTRHHPLHRLLPWQIAVYAAPDATYGDGEDMQRVPAILALAAMALMTAPGAAIAQVPVAGADTTANPYAAADRIFADYVLDAHIPGLVYGIVVDGQLVHVGTYGVQDLESKRPVTRDSLFRIASMTKAFTALTVLKLRDDGRVRLDAPAADYVPELRAWSTRRTTHRRSACATC